MTYLNNLLNESELSLDLPINENTTVITDNFNNIVVLDATHKLNESTSSNIKKRGRPIGSIKKKNLLDKLECPICKNHKHDYEQYKEKYSVIISKLKTIVDLN